MGEYDLKKTLFRNEVKVLEKAKKKMSNWQDDQEDNDLFLKYSDLVRDYEKLLRMTIKTYKISDIQGKMLKNQEAEIMRINKDLRKVEESRKRFISDISHEMGAPIRAILSFLKIIVDGKAELNPKYIQLIYERITVVNQLLQDLFDLSILEVNGTTFNFEQVPVTDLLKKLCSKYEIDVKAKGIYFVYEDLANPIDIELFVHLDIFRIDQVLTNLINNAIKFTPSGGSIAVTSELIDIDALVPKLVIKVSDTGAGMKEKDLSVIFERFYKGNEPINECGTGLGLAITKEIVLKHQGSIEVLSEENVGSTFIITLPTHKK